MVQQGAVEKWLGRVKGSKRSYGSRLTQFITWLRKEDTPFKDMTPEDLVAYQAENKDYVILDLIQKYIGEMEGRTSSKKTAYAVLRSLFLHNRAELPKDPSFNISSEVAPVNGELKPEQIKKMLDRSNTTYRAILLCIFQGALDLSCFEYWNLNGWEELKEQLDRGEQIIKITLPGRKKKRNETPFYTLIGPDAVTWIKNYIEDGGRPRGEKAIFIDKDGNRKEAIFYNKDGKPMTKHALDLYWLRGLTKEKLIKRRVGEGMGARSSRYGKNLHEMRDTFRTQWAKTSASKDVAEFLMGHDVDPLGYNKAMQDVDWAREEYKAALPMLQLWSEVSPLGYASRDKVKRLEAEIEGLKSGRSSEMEAMQAQIDLMMPAFNMVQRMFSQRGELEKKRGEAPPSG